MQGFNREDAPVRTLMPRPQESAEEDFFSPVDIFGIGIFAGALTARPLALVV